jgi:hypothetical protein
VLLIVSIQAVFAGTARRPAAYRPFELDIRIWRGRVPVVVTVEISLSMR